VLARVQTIGDTLTEVFERAEQANEPTSEIADRLAEERLRKARQSGGTRSQRDIRPAREVAGLVAG
jgi:leucine dehydrogenase